MKTLKKNENFENSFHCFQSFHSFSKFLFFSTFSFFQSFHFFKVFIFLIFIFLSMFSFLFRVFIFLNFHYFSNVWMFLMFANFSGWKWEWWNWNGLRFGQSAYYRNCDNGRCYYYCRHNSRVLLPSPTHQVFHFLNNKNTY